jgi:hypothetical protein
MIDASTVDPGMETQPHDKGPSAAPMMSPYKMSKGDSKVEIHSAAGNELEVTLEPTLNSTDSEVSDDEREPAEESELEMIATEAEEDEEEDVIITTEENAAEEQTQLEANLTVETTHEDKVQVEEGYEQTEADFDLLGHKKSKIEPVQEPVVKEAETPSSVFMSSAACDEKTEKVLSKQFDFDLGLHKELDFDDNPSALYLSLQERNWDDSLSRIKSHPEEATFWVVRKEEGGNLRWKLLPIHAAIIFAAPVEVVKTLADAYPEGVAAQDDQGMLPLHLSYRMGSTNSLVEFLLDVYPAGIEAKDGQGRTALSLAQSSRGPNKDSFVQLILQRAFPTSVTKGMEVACPGHQAILYTYGKVLDKQLDEKIHKLKTEWELKESALLGDVASLSKEVQSGEETNRVLEGHVTYLEKKLVDRADTESRLASRIAEVDHHMKDSAREKDDMERTLKIEKVKIVRENNELRGQLKSMQTDHAGRETGFEKTIRKLGMEIKAVERRYNDVSGKLSSLKEDHDTVKANGSLLEKHLKKKIASEQCLVEQVSALARQLAVANTDNEMATDSYTHRVRELEKEREVLRDTVLTLSKKLLHAAEFLESMDGDQKGLAEMAQKHKEDMCKSTELHDQIMTEVETQQRLVKEAMKGREMMATALKQQESILMQSEATREKILSTAKIHSEQAETTTLARQSLFKGATQMKTHTAAMLDFIASGMPNDTADDRNLVDKVIRNLTELRSSNCHLPIISKDSMESMERYEESMERYEMAEEEKKEEIEAL